MTTKPGIEMKALSVRQPYAGLIVSGSKTLEVRSKRIKYRGPLLICAGKEYHDEIVLNVDPPGSENFKLCYTLGMAIGVVDLYDCRPMTLEDEKEALFRFQENHFVYCFRNPKKINHFKVTGKLYPFNVKIPEGIEV